MFAAILKKGEPRNPEFSVTFHEDEQTARTYLQQFGRPGNKGYTAEITQSFDFKTLLVVADAPKPNYRPI